MSAPIRNRETMARQRRVGRLLFLLDLARQSEPAGGPCDPVELLCRKNEWRCSDDDPLARWRKLSEGDPVFRRRPPSALTAQLADDALDGQLQVLTMIAAAALDAAAS